MKKSITFWMILPVLLLALTGCDRETTVILPPETTLAGTTAGTSIPETQAATLETETTAAVTVPEASASTEAATQPQSSGKPTGPAKPTEPAKPTDPPATSRPTEPPATSRPTEPPATLKPTDPPETSKPTQPPETSAPTEPEATTQPTEMTAPPETAAPPAPTEPDVYDISGHTIGSLEYSILSEINARRAEEGLPGLTMDSKLCALSAIRAYECTQSWGHTRPDGRSCFTVLSDYNYNIWSACGENLLYCSSGFSAADMVDVWMNSDGHRANILNPEFTHAGIGVYQKDGLTYIANLFGG